METAKTAENDYENTDTSISECLTTTIHTHSLIVCAIGSHTQRTAPGTTKVEHMRI